MAADQRCAEAHFGLGQIFQDAHPLEFAVQQVSEPWSPRKIEISVSGGGRRSLGPTRGGGAVYGHQFGWRALGWSGLRMSMGAWRVC
jgi:hypothetical protein